MEPAEPARVAAEERAATARQTLRQAREALEAQVRLSAAEAIRETIRVDDGIVTRIEAAHLELAKAEAAAVSGAAMVELTALHDLDIRADDQMFSLPAGATDERAVTESLELLVPDVVPDAGAAGRGSPSPHRTLERSASLARGAVRGERHC